MTVRQILSNDQFCCICEGGALETQITSPFCCDLLSIAMSKAPSGAAWVTVMANVNTIAVASLAEVAVVILAEGVEIPLEAMQKAKEHKVTVLSTKLPIFDAALLIYEGLHE